ncbi:4906_t:CDS:2 [Dentiscutata erythropus]|uniref:4906_t:CDS:1 n=1 Tax=Dentiscutata erythropus TaxID=1348616 RepID=A0A9N9EB69_9GLOM|nr:4906_t:CDS:2 [Dentiscutata erythropus]
MSLHLMDSNRTSGETAELLPTEANTETRLLKKFRMVEPVVTDIYLANFTSVDNQNISTTQTQSGDSSLSSSKCSVIPKIEATTIMGEKVERENKYSHSDFQPQDLITQTQQDSREKLSINETNQEMDLQSNATIESQPPMSYSNMLKKNIKKNKDKTSVIWANAVAHTIAKQRNNSPDSQSNTKSTQNNQSKNTIDKIRIINHNVQGFNNDIKLQEYLEYCYKEEIQIIIMTETKLPQSTASRKALSNSLYKIYTANNDVDLVVNREASLGVAISIVLSFRHILETLKQFQASQTEVAQFIQQAKATHLNLIVAGDFNSNINRPNQSRVASIITHLHQFGMISLLELHDITKPIWEQNMIKSQIDNIWMNLEIALAFEPFIVKQAAKDNIPFATTAPKVFHAHSFKATQLHRGLKVANKALANFQVSLSTTHARIYGTTDPTKLREYSKTKSKLGSCYTRLNTLLPTNIWTSKYHKLTETTTHPNHDHITE